MSRFLLAFLTIFLFFSPAFCQESENLLPRPQQDSLSLHSEQDSLTANPARKPAVIKPEADTGKTEEFVPLFESDTVDEMLGAPRVMGDTAYVEPDLSHSPSKAIMLSLVLPGLGQGYNQKYFKIPIVWAAIAGAGYAINYNTKQYQAFAKEYAADPDNTDERYMQLWRRYMELSYIAMIGVYALQALDAYVDAQLYSWDVSENLSMGISPSLQPLMVPGSLTGQSYGLTCSFNLRRK
jgi:Family of unknown function (DUF5683)